MLASLVLGLLIATAKAESYDTTDRAIRSYAAELALLNENFAGLWGTRDGAARDQLRKYTERLLREWLA